MFHAQRTKPSPELLAVHTAMSNLIQRLHDLNKTIPADNAEVRTLMQIMRSAVRRLQELL